MKIKNGDEIALYVVALIAIAVVWLDAFVWRV